MTTTTTTEKKFFKSQSSKIQTTEEDSVRGETTLWNFLQRSYWICLNRSSDPDPAWIRILSHDHPFKVLRGKAEYFHLSLTRWPAVDQSPEMEVRSLTSPTLARNNRLRTDGFVSMFPIASDVWRQTERAQRCSALWVLKSLLHTGELTYFNTEEETYHLHITLQKESQGPTVFAEIRVTKLDSNNNSEKLPDRSARTDPTRRCSTWNLFLHNSVLDNLPYWMFLCFFTLYFDSSDRFY